MGAVTNNNNPPQNPKNPRPADTPFAKGGISQEPAKPKTKGMRMCCVCRVRKEDSRYFVRISRDKTDKTGEFTWSIGTKNGRGAHVCLTCIEKCVKTRALNRSFKTQVPQEIYDRLAKGG